MTAQELVREKYCPLCGKPLAPHRLGGLCPECLMKAGHGTGAPRLPGRSGRPAAFEPLTPAEVVGLFPELEVFELLGKGGMGAVYKVRQKGLGRLAALKILPPEASGDPAFAERFTREAQALARLNHTNIIIVYEFGQASGLFFFLMEYVEGVTLRHLLQSRALSLPQAFGIVADVCAALHYAHEEGLVHRDIKPENILIDKKGRVKLADFGLAKLMGTGVLMPLTHSAEVMGTPQYMAPEQIECPLKVDHRADIYAVGVVFYEMLTGELPLGRFAPPSRKVPVDARLDEVVMKALEKDPSHRYQRATELMTEIQRFTTTPAPNPTDTAAKTKTTPPSHRHRVLLLAAGLGLALLLILGLFFWWDTWLSRGQRADLPKKSAPPTNPAPELVAVPAAPPNTSTAGLFPVSITTFAGGEPGYVDGPRLQARFFQPYRLCLDAQQSLWVVESGTISFLASTAQGHHIRKFTPSGNVTTIAGSHEFGDRDGPAREARFRGLKDILFAPDGTAWIADMQNHRIRQMDAHGQVSTLAGSTEGYQNAKGTNAQLNMPIALAPAPTKGVLVADFGNCCIRHLDNDGTMTTFAGTGRGHQDGWRTLAAFDSPNDLAVGKDGSIFVSDWRNGMIRKISPDGFVSTLLRLSSFADGVAVDWEGFLYVSTSRPGMAALRKYSQTGKLVWEINSSGGFQDGPINTAAFGSLGRPVVLNDGSLLAADHSNHRIRQILMAPRPPAR